MAKNVIVKVRNGDLNRALKIFKKKVNEFGILQEVKNRQEFIKPSAIKREKKKQAIRKQYIELLKSKPNNRI
jgi:small subunit ribosomal protein S21